MNGIRTTVRLQNAMDEALARRGQLPVEQIRTCEGEAVVFADSIHCSLPPAVAKTLGLAVRGQKLICWPDGRQELLPVTGPIIFEILGRNTVEEALVVGDSVTIGHTVLAKLDLFADCARNRLIQNPAHPDEPVTKVK